MDGFILVIKDILLECGIDEKGIFCRPRLELPGYYRPEKRWDVLVVIGSTLLAVVECKSRASSFGNNLNNRAEEAVGSATDLWTAYREGAFPVVPRPWLGYLMLFVNAEESTCPVSVREPHFEVFPEFKGASYAERCRILLEKLMRERLYNATCFLMTPPDNADGSNYFEPNPSLSFSYFERSLRSHIATFREANNH